MDDVKLAVSDTRQRPSIRWHFFRDRHFYILLAFFIVCTLFYYFGELVTLFGWETLQWDIFFTVHDIHRLVFLVPILYSSYYYRSRGALLANIFALLIFLPRAIFISPYPDPTLRMVAFVIIAAILSALTVMLVNRRDNLNKSVEALKQSEERYRHVLEQMHDAYYEVDLAGKFTLVNDSVCRDLGYPREQLIGNNYSMTVPEEDVTLLLLAFNNVFRTGEPNKGFEHKIRRKDGSVLFVETSISLQKNAKGKAIGFRSISRDITERKRIEHQVTERMKELTALYRVSELTTREDITLDNLYKEVTDILPAGWQYPEISYARMVIGDGEFRTDNFTNSAWKQSAPVKVNGTVVGNIDVGYLEERPELDEGPFLKEERLLINAVAERIGHITERKQSEEALRNSEEKYRSLIENINDIFYSLDTQGNITYVSPVIERLSLYKVSDLIGKPFIPLIYPDDLPALLDSFNRLVSGHLEPWEFRIVDKDGRIIYVRTSSRPLYKDGEIVGITALMTDITERKKAEGDIQQRAALLDAAYDSIIAYDMEGKIIYANEAACSLRGYTKEEILAMNMRELVPQEELPNLEKRQKLLAEKGELSSEAVHIKKNREVFLVDTHLRLLELAGNKLTIAAHRDITERKQMEQKLEALATHDFLTGLPNRVLLTDRFNVAAALARRNKARLAVMSLDLDKFKIINDTLGHQAGDQVLKTISARLAGITRASDTIARVGGDEFVLVMLETSRTEDAASIGQKILDAFAEPLIIDGHQVHLSTSVGIAIYPEDAQDLDTLIKKSDAAMYFSKGHGRNRFKFFSDGDVLIGGDHRSGPPVRG